MERTNIPGLVVSEPNVVVNTDTSAYLEIRRRRREAKARESLEQSLATLREEVAHLRDEVAALKRNAE